MTPILRLTAVLACAAAAACGPARRPDGKIRVGHFPNVTHAQALVAHAATDAGRGWFEERLGPGVEIEWRVYNAGPNAIEALLAGSLDFTYVGPSPALTAYVRSKGEDVRVIAGAARGGAALVVRDDSTAKGPEDFRGKKIATPQLGNTQDVACRAWLAAAGLSASIPGDVYVLPMQNPEIAVSFAKGDVDAAWTVEPWVTRLETDAKGRTLLEEKDVVTTVLVTSARFLREQGALARSFAKAHDELTAWIVAHDADAKEKVRAELAKETRHDVSVESMARMWPRLKFDASIGLDAFERQAAAAKSVGFLRDAGDLSRLVDAAR